MKFYTVIFSALFFSFIASANAEVRKIGQSGVWEILSGTSHNGTPVCSIMTSSRQEDKIIALKYFLNADSLEIDISNDAWSIFKDVSIPVQFIIDDGNPYKVIAGKDKNTNHILFWFIKGEVLANFEKELRNGNFLKIHFPNESEPDWTISLNGANNAMSQLAACIGNMPAEQPTVPKFNVPSFGQPRSVPTPVVPTEPTEPSPTMPDPDSKTVIPPHLKHQFNDKET